METRVYELQQSKSSFKKTVYLFLAFEYGNFSSKKTGNLLTFDSYKEL